MLKVSWMAAFAAFFMPAACPALGPDDYTWYGSLKPDVSHESHHSIELGGFSYHWRLEGLNELNPGVGYTYRQDLPDSWGRQTSIGVLENSYERTSLYAYYGEYFRFSEGVRFSINVGFATGYKDVTESGVLPFLMPALHAYGVNVFLNTEFVGVNYTVMEW